LRPQSRAYSKKAIRISKLPRPPHGHQVRHCPLRPTVYHHQRTYRASIHLQTPAGAHQYALCLTSDGLHTSAGAPPKPVLLGWD